MSIQYNSFNNCQDGELPELPPIVSFHNSSDNNTISPQSVYGNHTPLTYSREEYRPEYISSKPINKNKSVPGLKYILSHLDDRPSRSPSLTPSNYYPTPVEGDLVSQHDNFRKIPKSKPMAGSKEWVHLRRENHKAVERKRRDCINDNINLLGELVPGPEKNKGGVLCRVVTYIKELQEANAQLQEDNNKNSERLHATINELSNSLRELEEENRLLKSQLVQAQPSDISKQPF